MSCKEKIFHQVGGLLISSSMDQQRINEINNRLKKAKCILLICSTYNTIIAVDVSCFLSVTFHCEYIRIRESSTSTAHQQWPSTIFFHCAQQTEYRVVTSCTSLSLIAYLKSVYKNIVFVFVGSMPVSINISINLINEPTTKSKVRYICSFRRTVIITIHIQMNMNKSQLMWIELNSVRKCATAENSTACHWTVSLLFLFILFEVILRNGNANNYQMYPHLRQNCIAWIELYVYWWCMYGACLWTATNWIQHRFHVT